MIKKNQHLEITIHSYGNEGQGVGRYEDFPFFVEGALVGETIEMRVVKLKKTYGFGKLISILEPSPQRTSPPCDVFHKCGGCSLQHMRYEEQLRFKQNKVKQALKRIGGLEVDVSEPIGMEEPYFYRNKAAFPLGYEKSADALFQGKVPEALPTMGFYSARSHQLVPVKQCRIQHRKSADVSALVLDFIREEGISLYDEATHRGLVRHLIIRTGFRTGEVGLVLVINGDSLPKAERLIEKLAAFPEIKSLVLNKNKLQSNVILGEENRLLFGREYIMEELGRLQFKLSPLSFFQVNPQQTEKMYDLILSLSGITKKDTVIDAYCGIGTISLYLAESAKKVYGIECVEEAVLCAKENAELNRITNTEFICGLSEVEVPKLLEACGAEAPSLIVLDPPRKGCEKSLLTAIGEMKIQKIIYVSCDPATLARDAGILKEYGYQIESCQPVDMFAQTAEVETVCALNLLV